MKKITEFWWFSCKNFTVGVEVGIHSQRIVFCAPIIYKFRGQHISNLARWMQSMEGFKMERIR